MTVCTADATIPYIRRTLSVVDCHANALSASGYRALTDAGSSFSIALGSILAVAVALFGYRMILGETPTTRTMVTTLGKFGIVLATVGSWPGFQSLVSDVVLLSPAQLTFEVGTAADIPGGDGSLIDRLDRNAMAIDAIIAIDARRAADAQVEAAQSQAAANVPLGSPINPDLASGGPTPAPNPAGAAASSGPVAPLGIALLVLRVSAVAGLAAVHITAAVLLALMPFFVAALLFDYAAGFAWGWARMLGATVLSGVGIAISLGIGAGLLEAIILEAADRATQGRAIGALANEILTTTVIVSLVELFMIVAAIVVATGLRIPMRIGAPGRRWSDEDGLLMSPGAATKPSSGAGSTPASMPATPRVMRIADALTNARHNPASSPSAVTTIIGARSGGASGGVASSPVSVPTGGVRHPFARSSATEQRRDRV